MSDGDTVDNDGWVQLHELSPEALVHWDRDGLGALDRFRIKATGWFEQGVVDGRYWIWWDYVCWVPSYEEYIHSSRKCTAYIHYPHGWIEDRGDDGKRVVKTIWHLVCGIASLSNPNLEGDKR